MDKKIKDLELEIQSLKRTNIIQTVCLLLFFVNFIFTKCSIWSAITDIKCNVNELIKISSDLVDILIKLSNLLNNYIG